MMAATSSTAGMARRRTARWQSLVELVLNSKAAKKIKGGNEEVRKDEVKRVGRVPRSGASYHGRNPRNTVAVMQDTT